MAASSEEEHEFQLLRNTLKFLRWHCMWPPEGKAFSVGAIFYVKMVIVLALLGVPMMILPFANMLNITINQLDQSPTESMGLSVTVLGLIYIQINYVMKQAKMARLCEKLSDIRSFGKPPDFDETNAKWDRAALVYKCYTLVTIVIYGFTKLWEAPICEKNNREKGLHEICGLVVPAYFPFEFYKKHAILFVYQVTASVQVASGSSTISFSTLDMAQHICCRIRHLNRLLVETFDDKALAEARLFNCIRYHQFIIGVVEDFNDCYKNIMGCYVMMVGVIFACLANIWIEESSLCSFLHLWAWIIALFVVCLAGQSLTSASETIPIEAYFSKWDEADVKLRKIFVMVLMRSQKPMYLKGQPVGTVLSLPLFVQLLHLGKDYPSGYEFFRQRLHRAFAKNKDETDPEKIDKMISHGRYIVKELETLYMLKKYRTLKRRYYKDP